jgi:hypoxia up-regulated 1
MEESKAKLAELARKDKERMMLEEARNKVESYIYMIKNKLMDEEEAIGKVTTEKQRAELSKLSGEAEEWMYEDGYSADLATMEDKYAELSTPMEKVLLRVSETQARPAMIKEMQDKLTKVEDLMKKWETTMPQVTEDERKDVLTKVEEFRAWMAEKEEAQSKTDPTEDPVFLSTDVPAQTKDLEILITRLSRKPKPKKEKKEDKNETKSEGNETATEGNATDAKNETSPEEEEGKAETSTEGTSEETKPDEAGEDEL